MKHRYLMWFLLALLLSTGALNMVLLRMVMLLRLQVFKDWIKLTNWLGFKLSQVLMLLFLLIVLLLLSRFLFTSRNMLSAT